ncbi:hypothetical protein VSAK1_26340 [Vibrio mediterranei AK1]|uniref:phage baseplate protein n=1 Tax=Vibrio mediterranei TaxID=689 RepID=UPI0001541315|nr:hypothetical protein [Vibrio mediterranei]EDL53762.1 hypothetical protein VSAK1_26340 [Vibrio mediterranei AK1]
MTALFTGLDKRVFLVPEGIGLGYNATGRPDATESPLLLDATSEVSVRYQTEVTNYYVNSGTDNTDHMKNHPRVISFSGVISDDLGLSEFVRSLSGTSESNPATAYQATIAKAIEDKQLFSVTIPKVGSINNCAITSCTFVTNKNLYNAFEVRLTLKEIRLALDSVNSPTIEVADTVATEKSSSGGGTERVEPLPDVSSPASDDTALSPLGSLSKVSFKTMPKVAHKSIGRAIQNGVNSGVLQL